jgi:hypothetical protein
VACKECADAIRAQICYAIGAAARYNDWICIDSCRRGKGAQGPEAYEMMLRSGLRFVTPSVQVQGVITGPSAQGSRHQHVWHTTAADVTYDSSRCQVTVPWCVSVQLAPTVACLCSSYQHTAHVNSSAAATCTYCTKQKTWELAAPRHCQAQSTSQPHPQDGCPVAQLRSFPANTYENQETHLSAQHPCQAQSSSQPHPHKMDAQCAATVFTSKHL